MWAPILTTLIPRALTIATSDSGGGAGIRADLKAFAAGGAYGSSVLVAEPDGGAGGTTSPRRTAQAARTRRRWRRVLNIGTLSAHWVESMLLAQTLDERTHIEEL